MDVIPNDHDPFGFLFELGRISSSQEEIFRCCPLVGQTVIPRPHEVSPSSAGIPGHSNDVLMASLPQTQDCRKDNSGTQNVFHAPPESSQPAFEFENCTLNRAAFDVDDEALDFVYMCLGTEKTEFEDLGWVPDLGFSDVELTQRVDTELVAECSHSVDCCEFNKSRPLERGLSLKDGLGDSPQKKLKLSGDGILASDTESHGNFEAGTQPQENVLTSDKITVELGNQEKTCGGISEEEKLGTHDGESEMARSAGKFGFHEVEPAVNVEVCVGKVDISEAHKLSCTGEGRILSDKGTETSERQKTDEQPGNCVLPPTDSGGSENAVEELPSSICRGLVNATKELESGTGTIQQELRDHVFAAFKVLAENCGGDSHQTVNLVEAAKIRGVKFPHGRWWPEKDIYRKGRAA